MKLNGDRRVIELSQGTLLLKNGKCAPKSTDLMKRRGDGRKRESGSERERIDESRGEFRRRIRCVYGSRWRADSDGFGHIVIPKSKRVGGCVVLCVWWFGGGKWRFLCENAIFRRRRGIWIQFEIKGKEARSRMKYERSKTVDKGWCGGDFAAG